MTTGLAAGENGGIKGRVIILMIIDVSSCPIMVRNRVFRDCKKAEGKLLD